jgi:hypothetical protein
MRQHIPGKASTIQEGISLTDKRINALYWWLIH